MKKSEIREFLDRPNVSFNVALHRIKDFVLEPTNKAIIANYIVTELKNNKNAKSKDLFLLFYLATKSLVTRTKLCNNKFAEQSLLRSVYLSSQFQNIIISLVRQGYKLLPVEAVVTKDDTPEDEESRKKRLKKQAALMREAKARKRAEKLAKEKRVEIQQKPKEKRVETLQKPAIQNTTQKKFSKEELEQIELLKRMRN